jgi:hypothetical protein
MKILATVLIAVMLAACSKLMEPKIDSKPVSLEGWRRELIALPPEFAPAMPTGLEVLLFAPGMFEATAHDFWSYAFVMQVEDFEPNVPQLTELFEAYYDGLLIAVGDGRAEIGNDPATVEITRLAEHEFSARVHLMDAFVTFKPIDLRLRIHCETGAAGATLLRVQASPQPTHHRIWTRLAAAAQSLDLAP